MKRRTWLRQASRAGLALGGGAWLALRPALANTPWPAATQAAIEAFSTNTPWREGLVQLTIEPLVENGNVVPVRLAVSPDELAKLGPGLSVRRLGLFTERNPEPGVGVFEFSALSAKADVSTRMRLATSGRVLALAQLSDGRVFGQAQEVMVTLAACIEE